MNANLRTYILTGLTILATFMLASPAQAQSNATDSTFFPLHQGNRWVYMSTQFNVSLYYVYDISSDIEIYGDTLYVWEDAFHPIIFPPSELGILIPDLGVNVQYDVKNNRVYGEGSFPGAFEKPTPWARHC